MEFLEVSTTYLAMLGVMNIYTGIAGLRIFEERVQMDALVRCSNFP